MEKYAYMVFYSEEDKSWISLCKEYPGFSCFGDDPEFALNEIIDLVEDDVCNRKYNNEIIAEPIVTNYESSRFFFK